MAGMDPKLLAKALMGAPRELPKPGILPGQLHLKPSLAPGSPSNVRPFAPGEYIRNPDNSWSSEISLTVGHPKLNGGKPTNIPSLWLVNGKPYRAKNEDEAAELAVRSGLTWPSFPTFDIADQAATDRETNWQGLKRPEDASRVPPLWSLEGQYRK